MRISKPSPARVGPFKVRKKRLAPIRKLMRLRKSNALPKLEELISAKPILQENLLCDAIEEELSVNNDDKPADDEGKVPGDRIEDDLSVDDDDCPPDSLVDGSGDEDTIVSAEDVKDTTESLKLGPEKCIEKIVQKLNKAKFIVYLQGTLGGHHNLTNALNCSKSVAKFLFWTYEKLHGTSLDKKNVLKWLFTIVREQYTLIADYADFCVKHLLMKPNTIKNHLKFIDSAACWLTQYGPSKYRLVPEALRTLTQVLTRLRSVQSKLNKENQGKKTLEQQVYTGKLPAGGLLQLRDVVRSQLAWADAEGQRKCIDDKGYYKFMCIMFSAFWVFSAQGRPGGISKMELDAIPSLREYAFTTTTQFKTRAKYAKQPITLAKESFPLFIHYVENLRPQVVARIPPSAQTERLWIGYDGKPINDVGRLVNSFFKFHTRLDISTNGIRSLVETAMEQMREQKVISTEACNAVESINGHSGQVKKDFYIMKAKASEVLLAREAFAAFPDEPTSTPMNEEEPGTEPIVTPVAHAPSFHPDSSLVNVDASATHLPIITPQDYPLYPMSPPPTAAPTQAAPTISPLSTLQNYPSRPMSPPPTADSTPTLSLEYIQATLAQYDASKSLKAADWGTGRSDYGQPVRRAVWTDAEVSYVGLWCEDFQKQYPRYTNILSKCLEHIRTDKAALPIFHHIHVMDTGRLRTGLDKWKQLKEKVQYAEAALKRRI